jgi:hypothetical protein
MHKIILVLLVIAGSCGLKNATPAQSPGVIAPPLPDSLKFEDYGILLKLEQDSYVQAYSLVRIQRAEHNNQVSTGKVSLDSAQRFFVQSIVNTLIPYWYGTTWSFEGHTTTPKQGEIACGYFVSTVLSHAGLNINRYRVAQQLPYYEALTYACGDSMYTLSGAANTITRLKTDEFKPGLYFIGLAGSHVGLLLKQKGEIFFIHSNYVDGKVVLETAAKSMVFNAYNTFYITNLSANKAFLSKWLNSQAVEVQTGT